MWKKTIVHALFIAASINPIRALLFCCVSWITCFLTLTEKGANGIPAYCYSQFRKTVTALNRNVSACRAYTLEQRVVSNNRRKAIAKKNSYEAYAQNAATPSPTQYAWVQKSNQSSQPCGATRGQDCALTNCLCSSPREGAWHGPLTSLCSIVGVRHESYW